MNQHWQTSRVRGDRLSPRFIGMIFSFCVTNKSYYLKICTISHMENGGGKKPTELKSSLVVVSHNVKHGHGYGIDSLSPGGPLRPLSPGSPGWPGVGSVLSDRNPGGPGRPWRPLTPLSPFSPGTPERPSKPDIARKSYYPHDPVKLTSTIQEKFYFNSVSNEVNYQSILTSIAFHPSK